MSLPRASVLDIPADKEHNRWVLGHAMGQFALRQTDRPYFATLSLEGPHPPLTVPREYYDMYDPASIPKPDNWDANAIEPDFLDGGYYRKLRHEWGDDFDAWRKSVAVYWGYATYIDALFGRFLDYLTRCGALENTMVVMVSDHGDMMGQHGLSQKMCPYDEALRVPCVISWPGKIAPCTRLTMDVSLVDLAPTMLAAAGVDPAVLAPDGESLLPYLVEGQPQPSQRDCFAEYTMSPFQQSWQGIEDWRAMVRRPWKYALHRDGQCELFNLLHDPLETDNLAGQPCGEAVEPELRDALLAWCGRVDPDFAKDVSTGTHAMPRS